MAKILLVEDDNNLREIYQARLTAEGYDIVAAQNGEEALVVAKQNKPDLIISDVMMPRISGFEMLDILRNTDGLKHTKVIMLTALGQAEDQQRAGTLGADKYLVKSQVTLEDIVNAAKELLEADGVTTPEPASAAVTTETALPAPSSSAPEPAANEVTAAINDTAAVPQLDAPADTSTPSPAPVAPVVVSAPGDTPVAPVASPAAIASQPMDPPAEPAVPASVVPQPDTTVVVPPAPANPTPPAVVVVPVPNSGQPGTSTGDTPAPTGAAPALPQSSALETAAPDTTPLSTSTADGGTTTPNDTASVAGAPDPSVPPIPTAETLTAANTAVADAGVQTLEAEEAALQAQIDSYAETPATAPAAVTPPEESPGNDQAIAAAVEELNTPAEEGATPTAGTPEIPVTPPPATAPEAVADSVAPAPAPSASEPSSPATTTPTIAGKKVIQPLNDISAKSKLDELLAKEQANPLVPPVSPAAADASSQPVTPPPAAPGQTIDPNSVAL